MGRFDKAVARTTPTGEISIGDINTELGTTGERGLGDADGRDLAGVTSGEISLDDYRGKSSYDFIINVQEATGVGGISSYLGYSLISEVGSITSNMRDRVIVDCRNTILGGESLVFRLGWLGHVFAGVYSVYIDNVLMLSNINTTTDEISTNISVNTDTNATEILAIETYFRTKIGQDVGINIKIT